MLKTHHHLARLLCVAALASAGTALGACGGGDDAKPQAAAGSPQRPLVGKITEETAPSGRKNEATVKPAKGAEKATAQAGTATGAPASSEAGSDETPGYGKLLDRQTKKPKSRFTPCNLVSPGQARAILGGELQAPLEAPQGPTCIYRTKSGSAFVTVAVQAAKLSQATKRLRDRRMLSTFQRPAYCGTYGQPMLYAELPGGHVLTIGARCAVAKKFAAHAVQAYDHIAG
jgi:hypothetical protein